MQIINPGDRIAQIMFTQYSTDSWEVVDELDETQRGEGGFGSTGTN
jgi:dUTP pyrophosphatase